MALQILQNVALDHVATDGRTSTVCEPSVADVGRQLLVTGNWFASQSNDGGRTWRPIDPAAYFPAAAGGFCCDQTVLHDPTRQLTFWLLQYATAQDGNVLRLALKQGETLDDDDWHWWDLVPADVNPAWAGEWFDYNHAALSDRFLHVVTNAYTTVGDRWTRSVVFRLPLVDLAHEGGLTTDYFQVDSQDGSSPRCTQGAAGTMYFAGHVSNRTLRVFRWPGDAGAASFVDVDVHPWQGTRGYYAPGPDGVNWLGRCDPRITGGWVADGVVGFMWTVDRAPGRPHPHVRVVRLDEATLRVIDEPDIWSPDVAYAYPEACPNTEGDVAITLFRGGGIMYPSHAVGIWDRASGSWTLQGTRNGTSGPADGKWGDYVTCRRAAPNGREWVAVGFTLQGGGTRRHIKPQVVRFAPSRVV